MSHIDGLNLIKQRLEQPGVTSKVVARELGYADSTIRLIKNGNYSAETQTINDKAIEVYGQDRICTHTLKTISLAGCMEKSSLPRPAHSPQAMAYYRACQKCPLKAKAVVPKQHQAQPNPQEVKAMWKGDDNSLDWSIYHAVNTVEVAMRRASREGVPTVDVVDTIIRQISDRNHLQITESGVRHVD